MNFDTDLVKKLIAEVKQKDVNFQIYGAIFHKYEFNPRLSERELLQFEEEKNIKLPSEYRQFLKDVGNGGGGPNFGIKSLHDAANSCDLSKKFDWTENIDEDDEEISKILDDWKVPGALQMSVEHYAFPEFLVVKGITSGTIWHTTPCNEFLRGKTFSEWYLDWLINCSKEIEKIL